MQSFFALGGFEEHVELHGIEALVADILKDIQLGIGQDRMWQTDHLAIALVRVQNAGTYTADILGKTHHEVLTDRVDSRVGNLRKLLTEVVEEDLWLVGKHSKRSIITHGCSRLLTLGSHRNDGTIDIFLAKTKLQFLASKVFHSVFHFSSAAQLFQFYTVGIQPLAIWMLGSQTLLDFTIVVDLTLLCIDEENLTRLQTTFLGNLSRIEIHDTYLRSHNHHIILGDGIACWAQTVSIEHTTGIAAIAEEQGGRSIPWLHQDRVILIESLQILRDRVLVVEALRHHHSHGVRQRQTAHHEELEYIVETCRVTHIRLNDRRNLTDIAQSLTAQHTLARLHPGTVTTDGVDLTIVGKETEWLSQAPCWEGVGREAGVNQSQTACEIIIGQVRIILAQLEAAQHTLIYDVRIRQRTDIEIRIADSFLDTLANEIEGALEDRHLIIGNARDEHLFDGRFVAQCSLTQTVRVGRHIAQVHQLQSLALNFLDHDRENILLFLLVLRQEDETRSVFSLLRHRDTLKKNKLMWNLEHDTGTVARLVISTLCTTMAHVLEYLQGVIDQLMTLVTVDIHHHTYATRIVLIG